MIVESRKLIEKILVLPNHELTFGTLIGVEHPLDVIEAIRFGDVADIYLTRIGAMGFSFLDGGNLASIEQFDFRGTGLIPDYVTQRKDEVVALQGRRLLFANFVAAALFGRIAALQHTSLTGAISVGMNDMLVFQRQGARLQVENSQYTERILAHKAKSLAQLRAIPIEQVANATAFTHALALRESQ
jgi:hypothetical protein